jgi:two-component system sensor kinase FixL
MRSAPLPTNLELESLRARVAELEQAEREMRRSAKLNRRIAEAMPGGVVQVCLDGTIYSANLEAQRLLGLTRDELSRRYVANFANDTFLENGDPCGVAEYPISQCLQTGEPRGPLTIGVRHPDGEISWAVFSAVPWHDPETGELAGAVVTFLDVTARKRIEDELRHRAELEKLIASISSHFATLPPEGLDSGFDGGLARMGEFAGIDRCYLLLLDEDCMTVRRVHEWCAGGVEPQMRQLEGRRLTDFVWFGQFRPKCELLDGIQVPTPEVYEVGSWLGAHAEQSCLLVPLMLRRGLIGVAAFDALCPKQAWTDELVLLLRMAGEIFANALARKEAQEALQASERRFRQLVDHATDAFFVHDLQGRINDVNHWACTSLRYSRAELLSMSLADLDPRWDQRWIAALWERVQAGEAVTFEGTHRREDGSAFPVEVHAGLFLGGDSPSILALARNVTERKRVEGALRVARDELEMRVQERTSELRFANSVLKQKSQERKAALIALQELEAKWRSLVQNAPDSVGMLASDGTILFVNRATRFPVEELVGKSVLEFIPVEHHARAREAIEHVFTTGEPLNFEFSTLEPQGQAIWYACRLGPIKNDGATTALILVATDTTLKKQAEEATQQHRAELAHVARLSTIGEMAAELAHELNQPLAAIANYAGGCIHRLKAPVQDLEELIAALAEITLQAKRASQILKGIRSFVRKREAPRALIDVNSHINAVVTLAAFEARKYGVTIQADLTPRLPLVEADSIQIEQVVLNLILNGIEAMHGIPKPFRRLQIRTSARVDNTIEVAVIDRGRGFAQEIADQMFNPFFTTKSDGLGMGLSISRSIVEAHGGRLWGVLNPDRGATFRFTVPSQRGDEADDCHT